jgi:hypothetical protein
MPTDTQHSDGNEEQQMDAVVIAASGAPAKSLAHRTEPVPVPVPGPGEVHLKPANPGKGSAGFKVAAHLPAAAGGNTGRGL